MTDKELLDVYMLGWHNELEGKEDIAFYLGDHPLKSVAYYKGKSHCFLGDEQTSFDYLSGEEIIKMIKQ